MKERALVISILMILVLSCIPVLNNLNTSIEEIESEEVPLQYEFSKATYDDHDAIFINNDGDFVTLGFPGDGSESSPYRIENLNITNSSTCIYITGVSVHYNISNCFLNNTGTTNYGIFLINAPNGTIEDSLVFGGRSCVIMISCSDMRVENCTITGSLENSLAVSSSSEVSVIDIEISDSDSRGIFVTSSEYLVFQNCTVSDVASTGIGLSSGNYSEVVNCTIFNCDRDGIEIRTNHSIVSGNTIYNNGLSGIFNGIVTHYLYNCTFFNNTIYDNTSTGLYLSHSNTNNITYNRLFDNYRGIVPYESPNTTITNNLIFHNTFGIDVTRSNSSFIYQNDIGWNTANARETSCTDLFWDNNETNGVGNWWSNYDGSPTYAIAGGGVDRYPHISLNASEAAPLHFETTSTGNILNWTQAEALNPSHYVIYVDDVVFKNSTWDGHFIELDVDSFSAGYYEVNLTVHHITGYTESSITYVNVTWIPYVYHDPIIIYNNGDFETLGFPGNGSEVDPYRIENLKIIDSGRCIFLLGVSVYFVISNCYLNSTGTSDTVLELNNAPNGLIEDSFVFGGRGVVVVSSPDTRIENCTFKGSAMTGITLSGSDGSSVIETVCSDSANFGIYVQGSDNVVVQNCTVYDVDSNALYITGDNCEVLNCTVFNNDRYGIATASNSHCFITENDVYNNGLSGNFPGINIVQGYNITVYDNDIYDNSYHGIYSFQSTRCNLTYNRIYDNDERGIGSYQSLNLTITHNLIYDNNDQGIRIYESQNVTITHNLICNNNDRGIDSSESLNMTITHNLIFNHSYGIYLWRVNSSFIYMNDICWNTVNARELSCIDLFWDNNETDGVGNWWSDYDGNPTYAIDTGVDRFPHISLNASVADPIEFEFGTTGNTMNWTQAEAINPSHYEVYVDGGLFANVTWDGLFVVVNVDSLGSGYYEVNLTVYHITGNYASSISYANVTDTTSPTWDITPSNQDSEYCESFSYTVSASNLRGIVDYWINDTTYFTISSIGQIANTSLVPVGIYSLEVRAYNPSGLFCSVVITITVSDTTAPTWTMTIEPQSLELGESFSYLLGAIDISGIQSWDVNDSVHFTIADGLLTNITVLDVGIYSLNVSVEDIYGNILYEVLTVTVNDTTSPSWTTTPENQYLDYGDPLAYQLEASDLSGIGLWHVNDSIHFTIVDGLLTSIGTSESGIYILEITVEDTHGNSLSTYLIVTVGDEPTTTPTTTETTTTTTTDTTTPPEDGDQDPMGLLILLGVGVGITLVVIIIFYVVKRKS